MKEKLLLYKTDNSFVQFFRYTCVGGLAFVIDYGLLFILTDICGVYYLISAAFAFLFGLTINYILCVVWVFQKRKLHNKSLEFGVFAMIGVIGLCFNELFIWSLTEYVHFHYLVSKIFAAGVVYLWNFFARKFMLFH